MMVFAWVVLPIICVIALAVYLYCKVSKGIECFFPAWTKKRKRLTSIILAVVIIVPGFRIYGLWFIILLHVTVLLLVSDLVAFVIRRIRKTKEKRQGKTRDISNVWMKIYRSGIIAILTTAIIMGYGRYNIFQVVRTEYTVQTDKELGAGGYKLVVLSDLHYGITLDGAGLQKVVDRINNEKADVIVLDGDIVDENTTYEQMKEAFGILGQIDSTYGIYYVYGNHDKNNYASTPNYTVDQLADTIQKSGINILEDDTAVIDDRLVLIGRADASDEAAGRKDISQLTAGLDPNKEWIVLDHQPVEYANVTNAGGDLIISGHTHAGQIWPAGLISSLMHLDDLNYGERTLGNLHGIVTAGIAGWGYPIRTEKHSEYVVINLNQGK